METRHTDLFRIVLMLNCFVLFLSFTGVRSAVSKPSIMDILKSDPQLCPTSKFLYDSEYTKSCASIAHPTGRWNYNPETLNSFLCLGVNDTAYKICQYSSQLQNFFNSTATFNSYVEKYVPNKNEDQEAFCNRLQGFTSLYNKTDSLWGQMVTNLNKPHKCVRICFDFQDKFHPLCAVFAWIKSIEDDIQRAKKIEKKQDSSDKPRINQLKDEIISDIKTIPTESKKTSEANESKEQNRKQITVDSNINNNVKEGDANVSGNAPLANLKFDGEKTKSDTEKTSNIQQKINNTLEIPAHKSVPSTFKENKENTIDTELGTNAEVAKPIKDIPPNSDSQAPSINNVINKKVVNEKNTEKSNKAQDIDDFKTSTLSENTQDHYDGNPDENMENDIDDIDETIPHPDTGNQNENVQGAFEQKNNNARLTEYSDARMEDDSHFFTYFTVITLACLAGYIGYHNKQKIFAIVLEGRRSRSNRGRRRPSTASYRKLDCTLEEAVTSQ